MDTKQSWGPAPRRALTAEETRAVMQAAERALNGDNVRIEVYRRGSRLGIREIHVQEKTTR